MPGLKPDTPVKIIRNCMVGGDDRFVGLFGKVGIKPELNTAQFVPVVLDGEDQARVFLFDEVSALGARVVEGYVDDQGFVLEECGDGTRTAFMRVGKEYRGKYIRVTVEELDKPADITEANP